MTMRDLRNKYGGNPHIAMRRAIRAEIAGGARVLDELEYWSGQVNQHGEGSHAETAYLAFCDLRDEMIAEVRKRYGIVTKPQTAD